jgi:hypothetical protein
VSRVTRHFNCTMLLNDSDGNVFTTSFTPGIPASAGLFD